MTRPIPKTVNVVPTPLTRAVAEEAHRQYQRHSMRRLREARRRDREARVLVAS